MKGLSQMNVCKQDFSSSVDGYFPTNFLSQIGRQKEFVSLLPKISGTLFPFQMLGLTSKGNALLFLHQNNQVFGNISYLDSLNNTVVCLLTIALILWLYVKQSSSLCVIATQHKAELVGWGLPACETSASGCLLN
jgi:hypothetical protein